jgi:hypothetical protein
MTTKIDDIRRISQEARDRIARQPPPPTAFEKEVARYLEIVDASVLSAARNGGRECSIDLIPDLDSGYPRYYKEPPSVGFFEDIFGSQDRVWTRYFKFYGNPDNLVAPAKAVFEALCARGFEVTVLRGRFTIKW